MSTAPAEAAATFANLVRRGRRMKEMPVSKLAHLMGWGITSASHLERGLRPVPPFPEVLRLARFLEPEVRVDELLTSAVEARQSIEIDLAAASPDVVKLAIRFALTVQQGLDPPLAKKLKEAFGRTS
ncbi:MAG: helix-turn-helix transcriptional regulator [Isosphaeraceae bacterium]|jgi:hypothetical protein